MKKKHITVLLPAGRLPHDIMQLSHELAKEHNLGVYLTTLQNLRLTDIPEDIFDKIKETLASLGATFKAPGVFPMPRVCVGKPHCELAKTDVEKLNNAIVQRCSQRGFTKPKVKIAIAACPASCAGAKTSDIGIISTRDGYDLFVGGKGGAQPKAGKRVMKSSSEEKVVSAVETLLNFHDEKTPKKQRLFKLLEDPEFPFKLS